MFPSSGVFLSFAYFGVIAAVNVMQNGTAVARGNWTTVGTITNFTSATTNLTLTKRDAVSYTINGLSSYVINFHTASSEVDFSLSSPATYNLDYYFMLTSNVAACTQNLFYSCTYFSSCSCIGVTSCTVACTLDTSTSYSLVIGSPNYYQTTSSGTLTNYVCSAGQYGSSGSCLSCPAGTQSFSGSSSCTPCAAGSYSTTGSQYCYYCSAGTYSTTSSSASCSNCPAGTYSTTQGATSSSACITCPSGTTSTAGAISCTSSNTGSSGSSSSSSNTGSSSSSGGSTGSSGSTSNTGSSGSTGSSSNTGNTNKPSGAISKIPFALSWVLCFVLMLL